LINSKISCENSGFTKIGQEYIGHVTGRPLDFFFIGSLSVLLRMRNVSDKSCRENQNTHFEQKPCHS